tara:strand:+ start:748 stop:954 length:207 start_codon:yes stop_codon:yes gene_type:complete
MGKDIFDELEEDLTKEQKRTGSKNFISQTKTITKRRKKSKKPKKKKDPFAELEEEIENEVKERKRQGK